MSELSNWQAGLLVVLVTAAGLWDVHTGRIPNTITYATCGLGLGLALMLGGVSALGNSALGLVTGFVPFLLLYLRGGMGGGDVKLIAAIGAVKGFPFVVNAMIASILVGGFIALAIVIWEGRLLSAVRYVASSFGRIVLPRLKPRPIEIRRAIPFGAAVCLGSFLVLMREWLLAARAPAL